MASSKQILTVSRIVVVTASAFTASASAVVSVSAIQHATMILAPGSLRRSRRITKRVCAGLPASNTDTQARCDAGRVPTRDVRAGERRRAFHAGAQPVLQKNLGEHSCRSLVQPSPPGDGQHRRRPTPVRGKLAFRKHGKIRGNPASRIDRGCSLDILCGGRRLGLQIFVILKLRNEFGHSEVDLFQTRSIEDSAVDVVLCELEAP